MYITKIQLKNVRCFEEVSIDLGSEKEAKRWLIIVGDNNVGKTSLLRAIAIGLCDQTRAASLLGDTYGKWIRKDKKDAQVEIHLSDGQESQSIKTKIQKSAAGSEMVSRKQGADERVSWKKMFVCGFGANRSIEGNTSHESYSMADALYTLFNYDYPSQHPELMLRRIAKNKEDEETICSWIDDVLMLSKGSTKLTDDGLVVTDKAGHDSIWGSFGGGYEATITLLLDMLGWALLAGYKHKRNELEGIVLIDELEQHLHPELQRYIVLNLSDVFPNIQFVATSHSPLCAAGLADLPDDKCELQLLTRGPSGSVKNEQLPTMRGWRYDRIMGSDAFGIPDRNVKIQRLMDQISELYMKEKRSSKEESKLKKLMEQLKRESPVGAEAEQFKNVNNEIRKIRQELSKRKG